MTPPRHFTRDNVHIFSEFEDLDRQHYIQMILASDEVYQAGIPRVNLFYLWFADKEVLRQMAYREGHWNSSEVAHQLFFCPAFPAADPVATIINGVTTDLHVKSLTFHDHLQIEKALTRDGDRCILTKHGRPGVEVAHLVSPRLHTTPLDSRSWILLERLWKTNIQAWQEAIVGPDKRYNTERPTNIMSVNRLLLNYWESNLCALRSVRVADDQMSMDISFHWLPPPAGLKDDLLPMDQNPYGDGAEQRFLRSPGDNLLLFDYETDQVIRSGDIFTITTTDKENRPLPSKELLDFLWLLKRIAAMQGAEKPKWDDEDSDMD